MMRTLIYLRRNWVLALGLWLVLNCGIWLVADIVQQAGSAPSTPGAPAPIATTVPPAPPTATVPPEPTSTPQPSYDAQLTLKMPTAVWVGQHVTAYLKVTNTGSEPLQPLTIAFKEHVGDASYLTVTEAHSPCTPQHPVAAPYQTDDEWTFGTLAPGKSCVVRLRIAVGDTQVSGDVPHAFFVGVSTLFSYTSSVWEDLTIQQTPDNDPDRPRTRTFAALSQEDATTEDGCPDCDHTVALDGVVQDVDADPRPDSVSVGASGASSDLQARCYQPSTNGQLHVGEAVRITGYVTDLSAATIGMGYGCTVAPL